MLWWHHIGQVLNVAIPFLLMVPSTYFLLSDLQNEERHGTLDFIRQSPRSASSIFLGKILGVPILVYVAIASLLPFYVYVTLQDGNSPRFLASFYPMIAAGSFLIFSLLSLMINALYALIAQFIVIQKIRQRNFIAIAIILMLITAPSLFAYLLALANIISIEVRDSVILSSPVLWILAERETVSMSSIFGAFLGQLSLMIGINVLIARQVHQLGASELAKLKPSS